VGVGEAAAQSHSEQVVGDEVGDVGEVGGVVGFVVMTDVGPTVPGVAGSATIARTNQYKTGKFIRQFMEDFATATDNQTVVRVRVGQGES